jgi:hypothetical protein
LPTIFLEEMQGHIQTLRMRNIQSWPVLMSLFLLLAFSSDQAAQNANSRLGDISRLSTTGTLTSSNRNDAQEDMREMAGQLQALYDMGGEELSGDDLEEIEDRSEELADAVSNLLGLVNQVRRPTEAEPVSVPDEDFDRRSLRMVTLYVDLVDPLTEFVSGEQLDSDELDQLRSGLMMIEALTAALPESEL